MMISLDPLQSFQKGFRNNLLYSTSISTLSSRLDTVTTYLKGATMGGKKNILKNNSIKLLPIFIMGKIRKILYFFKKLVFQNRLGSEV